MAVNDIHQIDSSKSINNFNVIINTPGTGYQTHTDRVSNLPVYATIQEKYENKYHDADGSMLRSDKFIDVVIASGETASEGLSIADYSFGSFEVRSTFTGPSLNFETKMRDSSNWQTAQDSTGAALTGVAVTTGTVIALPTDVMYADMLRFSAASGQSNDVDIKVLVKG